MTLSATPTLPIADIKLDASVNPRIDVDTDADAELVASIKEHGVLQPLLVRKNGDGYQLVAGSRRLRCAKKAGLKEVPVHAADLNGGALAAAIVENLQREDLSPVEEAESLAALQELEKLSLRDLGKRVGKSKDYVGQRLRLRALPEKAKAAVADGRVTLHGVPNLVKVAELAPAIADKVVAEIEDPRDVEEPGELVRILDTISEKADAALWDSRGFNVGSLPVDDAAQLASRLKKATGVLRYHGSEVMRLEPKDIDAARAFGCLLEVNTGRTYDSGAFVTDGAWLADQVRPGIDKLEKEADKKSSGKTPAAAVSAGDPDAIAAAKEARRKEREREERARATARGRNLDLGVKTAKAFKSPKLTADVVRLLAELALDGQDAIAQRGLRYVDEALQTEEAQKNGKAKITYADSNAAAKKLRAELDRAKTPEEIAGVVLRAVTAARYASQDVLPQSSRSYYHLPGSYSSPNRIGKLIDKIAGKLIPAGLKAER